MRKGINDMLNIPSIPHEEYKERAKKVQETTKKDGIENLTNYPRELFEIDC